MKAKTVVYEAKLERSVVDTASEHIRNYLSSQKLERKDISRYAISVEELLIKAMEKDPGNDVFIRLEMGTRFFRPFIMLAISGGASNLYLNGDGFRSVLTDGILKNIGVSPEYSYSNGENRYLFHVTKKKLNPFLPLITALVLAFTVGFVGLLIPEEIRKDILSAVLLPLHDTFLNILGCIAGPMIFLSVAWGIYGIGDAATLKQVGKKVLSGYVITVFFVVIIIGWILVPFFSLNFSGSDGGSGGLSAIFSMILGFIPENIFSPFVNGNTMQIIFLAIVIGLAMLFLGQKTTSVAKAVEQINYMVQFLIDFISRLVPFFIFLVLVKMIWEDSISILLTVGKLFGVLVVAVLGMFVLIIGYTAIRNRVNPLRITKKVLPILLIAITTASSAAAFGTNMNICKNEFGIDDKIASFGLPLGIVAFKPTTALSYTVVSLFFAEMYGIDISLAWLLLMMFSAAILALATPPIPGGALTAYTVLFAQLGIPAEALAIALTCDTILDFITTGGDQFMLPFILLNRADKLGMADRRILVSKQ